AATSTSPNSPSDDQPRPHRHHKQKPRKPFQLTGFSLLRIPEAVRGFGSVVGGLRPASGVRTFRSSFLNRLYLPFAIEMCSIVAGACAMTFSFSFGAR